MLYISRPLPMPELESWVRPDARRERDTALHLLQRLHILKTAAEQPGAVPALALTKPFVGSLRQALTGGGQHRSFGVPVAQLDEFARRQWEGVLGYMVGSAEGVALPTM